MILIYTIEGSGTHSLMDIYGKQTTLRHTGDKIDLDEYEVVTTYRDPYRVGACWANRCARGLDEHPRMEFWQIWKRQWEGWAKAIPQARVYTMDELPKRNEGQDTLGLHAALGEGDMDHFHHYVPERYIDFAQTCAEVLNG